MFDDLAVQLNGDVHELRGEGFMLMPRARPDVNALPTADLTRVEVEFIGTYDDPGVRVGSGREDWGSSLQRGKPGHGSDHPMVRAERRVFCVRPRQGDLLLRLATEERFAIAEVVPHGSLYLLQLHR